MDNKKQLIIVPAETYAWYKVKYLGGGQLPDTLKGNYTSIGIAQKAIDIYLASKGRGK